MYRIDRAETTRKCKHIVDNYQIRTQKDFANVYKDLYGTEISQTTVHRMFENANIETDKETGFYVYKAKELSSEDTTDEDLFSLLSAHSYGKYSHSKGVASIWLSVDFDTEKLIARRIYDFCDGNISILYGYLWLRCTDIDTYNRLKDVISVYKR